MQIMLFGINVLHIVPTCGPATWVLFLMSRLLPPTVHIFIWKDPPKGLPDGQKMTNLWSPKFFGFAHALLGCTHCSVWTWLHASNPWALLAHLDVSCKQTIPVLLQKHSQAFPFSTLHWIFLCKIFQPFFSHFHHFALLLVGFHAFHLPLPLSVNSWLSSFFQSPHTTLACWLVFSSQLVKLWSPSALFWWTSGEGFVSEPVCLSAATAFTRITDYLASKQKGKLHSLFPQKVGGSCTAGLKGPPHLSKPLDSACLSWAKTPNLCLWLGSMAWLKSVRSKSCEKMKIKVRWECISVFHVLSREPPLPSSPLFCLTANEFHQISIFIEMRPTYPFIFHPLCL